MIADGLGKDICTTSVHFTKDPELTRCAIALMTKILEATQQGRYATNNEILHTFDIGLKQYARRTAGELLINLGYVERKRVPGKGTTLAWTALREHRTVNSTVEKVTYRDLPVSHEYGGYVYIARRIRDGIYKVGQTQNLRNRFSTIACNCGSHLQWIAYFDFPYYQRLETELQNNYHKFHIIGEWFDFPDPIVDGLISILLDVSRKYGGKLTLAKGREVQP